MRIVRRDHDHLVSLHFGRPGLGRAQNSGDIMMAVSERTQSAGTSVFRPAMLLMSGQAIAFAATFFIPVVLARALSPAEFGTYKQLFLLYSTAFLIGQAGMASSLYYFVPRSPADTGRYAANATVFLGSAGLAGLGLMWAGATRL